MGIMVLDFFQRQVKPLGKCNCIVFGVHITDYVFAVLLPEVRTYAARTPQAPFTVRISAISPPHRKRDNKGFPF